ncbi:MAG: DUF1810 domain-containing protein [Pseudomonadota bacterium]
MTDGAADLERFASAQTPVIGAVMAELARGRKETHWMWFVFPQLRALGQSERALYYGIAGREEAEAYASHPVLAARVRAGAELLLSHAGQRSAVDIMGEVDAMKLRSSMTLFAMVAHGQTSFPAVLDGFYAGHRCARTEELLQ